MTEYHIQLWVKGANNIASIASLTTRSFVVANAFRKCFEHEFRVEWREHNIPG